MKEEKEKEKEQLAKKILDNLAKKIPYASFELHTFCNVAGIEYSKGPCLTSALVAARSLKEAITITTHFKTHAACLEHLLELSRDGWKIEVYQNNSIVRRILFMQPCTTLEKLLVEMDLANRLR